jgi:hypothetical protein
MEVFLEGAVVAGMPWMLPGGSDNLLKIKITSEILLVPLYVV